MEYQEKIENIVDLLKSSGRTFALTGAGVSTESGIPDYRSPGTGLWTKKDPAKVGSISALLENPAEFYNNTIERWMMYSEAVPNNAHIALAQLERRGLLAGLITQNIDGLHVKAGSKNVYEVHGHLRTCRCFDCKKSYSMPYLAEQYRNGVNPPRCEVCNGILRPDVVLFGDDMGESYFRAFNDINGCELLIVAGSSLQVYPVASLPAYAEKLVIINIQETPYDRHAEVVLHEQAGRVFTDLIESFL